MSIFPITVNFFPGMYIFRAGQPPPVVGPVFYAFYARINSDAGVGSIICGMREKSHEDLGVIQILARVVVCDVRRARDIDRDSDQITILEPVVVGMMVVVCTLEYHISAQSGVIWCKADSRHGTTNHPHSLQGPLQRRL